MDFIFLDQESEQYIKKLEERSGKPFSYAPSATRFSCGLEFMDDTHVGHNVATDVENGSAIQIDLAMPHTSANLGKSKRISCVKTGIVEPTSSSQPKPHARKRKIIHQSDNLISDNSAIESKRLSAVKDLDNAWKECNRKASRQIANLETELKNEQRKFQEEVAKLKEKHDLERSMLQGKINQLEKENSTLANQGKCCVECGKIVATINYCNDDCHEKSIR